MLSERNEYTLTERVEFTGKTKDAAIAAAMEYFKVTAREHINVRIIEEGSKGIFGLGAKDAKIVAYLKSPEEITALQQLKKADVKIEPKREEKRIEKPVTTEEKKTQQVKPEEPAKVIDTTEARAKADTFINELIKKMGIDCSCEVSDGGNCVKVVISGEDVGTVIGRRGETLDAIQYLTNLHVNKGKHGDDYVRITIDVENYRAKREETLIRLANSMASKVSRYHKEMALEPMNPYERRIIHSALQNHKYVKTRSVGDEPYRRVLISPKSR